MIRLAAVQAANDALNELRLDQAAPIDPFEAIESAGLELRFRPLKDLLGAVLPGNPGGVLINSGRPAALQRYTAAHELGHWYMDQNVLSVDTDDAVLGHQHHESRERNAQIFAAHFLMPLELLYTTARRYGIKAQTVVNPEQVYQAARDMHVSYEAAVRQLTNTKHISASNSAALLKTRPAVIKQRLTGGMHLPNARGDVWIVEHPHDHAEVKAFVGDAIVLRFTERPATGYRWCAEEPHATIHPIRPAPQPFSGAAAFADLTPEQGGEVISFPATAVVSDVVTLLLDRVVGESYQAGETVVGGAVTRIVAYTADSPGEEAIHFNEIRPVRPDAPVDRLKFTTLVRGVPEVEYRQRLLASFMRDEYDGDDRGDLMRKDVDLRPLIGPQILDQGYRPTCVAFASAAAHEAMCNPVEHLAPEALWWQATTAGHTSPNGMTLDNVDPALRGHGQPALTAWAYDPHLGAGTESPPTALAQPPWRRAALQTVPLRHDGVEDALEDELARDRPVILILEVTEEFQVPGPDGIVAVPDVRTSAGGYHAVTCVGAATHPTHGRLLLIKNSWGVDWGLGGYCWLPVEYLVGFAGQAATINDVATES